MKMSAISFGTKTNKSDETQNIKKRRPHIMRYTTLGGAALGGGAIYLAAVQSDKVMDSLLKNDLNVEKAKNSFKSKAAKAYFDGVMKFINRDANKKLNILKESNPMQATRAMLNPNSFIKDVIKLEKFYLKVGKKPAVAIFAVGTALTGLAIGGIAKLFTSKSIPVQK